MKRWLIVLMFTGLLLALIAPAALAQLGFELSWWTVEGGGVVNLSQGGFSLSGSAGQPDAGGLQNGAYTLSGGFWPGAPGGVTPSTTRTFLPVMIK